MSKLPWSKDGALSALGYVAMFLVLASVLRQWFGFPLDDSWIHEVVARNLAEYKIFGFVPGHLTSGSTSLLWSLILAFRPLVFPALSPVMYCVAISAALLAGIGYVLKVMTEEDGLRGGASWCIALAPAASGNFLWFGLLGMEHLLFILLSLGILSAWWVKEQRREGWRKLVLPVLCFLLVLTRPEGLVLTGLLFLSRRSARRSMADWTVAAAGTFLGAALSAAISWRISGHLAPLTMQGRSGVLSASSWSALRAQFVGHALARFLSVWGIDIPQHVLHGRGLVLGIPLVVLLAALTFIAIRTLWSTHAHRLSMLSVWCATIIALYFFKLPTPGHGGRYLALPVMFLLPLVFFGLGQLFLLFGMQTRTVWIAVGIFGLATAAVSLATWSSAAAADIEQINTEHGMMGLWIGQNLPASAIVQRQVAVYDIGRIGYTLHGNLVDLGGLVDSKFHDYFVTRRTAAYLQQHNVLYVVLPGGVEDPQSNLFAKTLSLDPAHGADLSLVHTICADAEAVRIAETSSETASACQRIYSIRYTAVAVP